MQSYNMFLKFSLYFVWKIIILHADMIKNSENMHHHHLVILIG